MQIKTLSEIFSVKFYRKTKSTIKDEDVSIVIERYTINHESFEEISRSYKTSRKIIKKIVESCLSQDEFINAKSKCYSRSVNSSDRLEKQVSSWKKNNQDWVPPLKTSECSIKKMLETRSKNLNYVPHKNFGNTSGRNNGRYIKVDDEIIHIITELLNKRKSINSISKTTSLSSGKVISLIKEYQLMNDSDFKEYRRLQLQSEPEWRFENLLTSHKIEFEYQFKISHTCEKSGRKTSKKYDFYIPSINTIVEIDGEAWHNENWCKERNFSEKHLIKVKAAIENDLLKDQIAKKNGFNITRVKNTNDESLIKCIESLNQSIIDN